MDANNSPPIPKPGQISWNELMAPNADAAAQFYSELFGWTATPFNPGPPVEGVPPYRIFGMPGLPMPVGGLVQIPVPEAPGQWLTYVVVAQLDESLAKAISLGATQCLPTMEVPTVGRITIIQDPSGARIGLHELAK